LEAGEEIVEDGAQFGQLVGGLAEVEALVQVAGGDRGRGGGDGPQGPEEAAGDEPAGSESDRDEDGHRDGGADQQLVRAEAAPGAGELAGCPAADARGRLDVGQRQGDGGEHHDPGAEDDRGVVEGEPGLE
jgi:hypothetical protein